MKLKYLFFLVSIVLTLNLSSCSDDNEPKSTSTEYYVKYELKTTSVHTYKTIDVTVYTEKGLTTTTVPRNWEGTFGPFTQLENLKFSIRCNGDYYGLSTYNGRISICRGNQPYILKADKTVSNAPLEMNYQVVSDDLK